jgi:large subunit ribosomal protein L30
MSAVKFVQVKSSNGANQRQLGTLRSLGLGRIGRESQLEDTPQLRGALHAVRHLVKVLEG